MCIRNGVHRSWKVVKHEVKVTLNLRYLKGALLWRHFGLSRPQDLSTLVVCLNQRPLELRLWSGYSTFGHITSHHRRTVYVRPIFSSVGDWQSLYVQSHRSVQRACQNPGEGAYTSRTAICSWKRILLYWAFTRGRTVRRLLSVIRPRISETRPLLISSETGLRHLPKYSL